MSHTFITLSTLCLYFACTAWLTFHVRKKALIPTPLAFHSLVLLTLLAHSAFLNISLFKNHILHLNFFTVSPLIFFIVVAVLWLSLLNRQPTENILLPALPMSAFSIIWAAYIPDNNTKMLTDPGLITHTVLSIIAYSLLIIATLQAIMLAIQEHALKSHRLNSIVRFFPPLQTMEKLLFQALALGFVLLTIAIFSGFIFLEDMFAQHLVHKTILSLIAWLLFAVLLYGHYTKGWRGITVTRWIIVGFVFLMLAYYGSKFVLEFILHRV